APVLLLDRAGPVRAHPGADALDRADGAAGMAGGCRLRLVGPDPVDVSPIAGRRAAGGAHLGVALVGALPGGLPDVVRAARGARRRGGGPGWWLPAAPGWSRSCRCFPACRAASGWGCTPRRGPGGCPTWGPTCWGGRCAVCGCRAGPCRRRVC